MRRAHRFGQIAPLLAVLALSCSAPDPATSSVDDLRSAARQALPQDMSPGGRPDLARMLRAGANRARGLADGGGRAWLVREPDEPLPQVSQPGRFEILFEVGPLGIAKDGSIYLQVSPFWGWSTPQVQAPGAEGFTRVEVARGEEGIELETETLGEQLLGIRVTGRPLVEGDRIRIIYGAGPAGAIADQYAERGSRFWIAVDGDGDGNRINLPDSPTIEVLPGPPAQLHIAAPSTARPGDSIQIFVSVLDASGNTGVSTTGDIRFEDPGVGLALPEQVTLTPGSRGRTRIEARVSANGVYRIRATGPGGLSGESNPVVVSDGPRVLWGDLHGHSNLSDGTGTVEDYFGYARDVAGLDVASLTDHDHWGILPLDGHPEIWREIREKTHRFHEPGRFVTLLGFEWTHWIHGHRHVLFFDGKDHDLISSIDPDTETPTQLWAALAGQSALTFAHHSAGGPIATNWNYPPDPHFEPVTEIVSVHGSSEARDSPGPIYNGYPGNYVRDILGLGYRFGFIGSGDSHDGHPGLSHLASGGGGYGGLAAILSEDRTREGVLAALRARRVYASNGPRILLRTALGTHRMGSTIRVDASETLSDVLYVRAVAPAPIARVDLIRSGEVVDVLEVGESRDVEIERRVEDLAPGEYIYVRVVQEDGGAVWSSPIYVE